MTDKQELLAEETLIVRHSGEIPEIAFHGSIFYLTQDDDGPGIELTQDERALLQEQVLARYREIILRDLTPENRDKSIYRGVKRAIFNWERLGKFCRRESLGIEEALRQEVAEALCSFLAQEYDEVREQLRTSSLNCTHTELCGFAEALGLASARIPDGIKSLCLVCHQ